MEMEITMMKEEFEEDKCSMMGKSEMKIII